MQRLLARAAALARASAPVVLQGETGTGKEVLAARAACHEPACAASRSSP